MDVLRSASSSSESSSSELSSVKSSSVEAPLVAPPSVRKPSVETPSVQPLSPSVAPPLVAPPLVQPLSVKRPPAETPSVAPPPVALPSVEPPSVAPLSVETPSQDALMQLAKEINQQPFTTSKNLQQSLQHRQQALRNDKTEGQYLVFTSVPPRQSSQLSNDRSRTSKYCRFFYNAGSRLLIAKIMPNAAHELAIRSFDSLISLELRAMRVDREVRPLGSTTVTSGDWVKEADSCWAPVTTLPKLSFVVEVGLSESSRQLSLSAHGWLESRSSPVQLVLTISIKRHEPEIVLRRWELAHAANGIRTRASPLSAHCTASLTLSRINDTTSVTGESYINGANTPIIQLSLPFSNIVGRPPRSRLERDLVITEQELKSFAEDIWCIQTLL